MEVLPLSNNFVIHSLFRNYEVRFEDNFTSRLQASLQDGDFLIVDANIRNLYSSQLKPFLENWPHIVIEPSEERKSYVQLESVIQTIIESGVKKNHRLVAIGGGIIQDITGFIASILYRGVDWLFYPTTLLAQCDSCIGSKTSINFGPYKNQLGGFYPPAEIVIDLNFVNTLPEEAIRSGLGEMIHYFLVSGEADYQLVKANYARSLTDSKVLRQLVLRSLQIKHAMIEQDEFDRGPRQVFNYGHSFGHAIESLTNYRIQHGIAVSFGMDLANHLSAKLGYIREEQRQAMRELLSWNWASTELGSINVDMFLNALSKDKKNVGSEFRVILTRGPGKMFKTGLEQNETVAAWLQAWFDEQHDGAAREHS
jgi:3-dehydroquinate synthase